MARIDGLVQTLQGVLGTEEEGLFGINRYRDDPELTDSQKLDAIIAGQNKKSSGFVEAPSARSKFVNLSGLSVDNRMAAATKQQALGFQMPQVVNAAQTLRDSATFNPFVAKMLGPLITARRKGTTVRTAGANIPSPTAPKVIRPKKPKVDKTATS